MKTGHCVRPCVLKQVCGGPRHRPFHGVYSPFAYSKVAVTWAVVAMAAVSLDVKVRKRAHLGQLRVMVLPGPLAKEGHIFI